MSNSLCFKGEIPATGAVLQQIASSSVLAGEDTERSAADLGLLLWLQRRKNAHSLLIIWACKESISLSKYLIIERLGSLPSQWGDIFLRWQIQLVKRKDISYLWSWKPYSMAFHYVFTGCVFIIFCDSCHGQDEWYFVRN